MDEDAAREGRKEGAGGGGGGFMDQAMPITWEETGTTEYFEEKDQKESDFLEGFNRG